MRIIENINKDWTLIQEGKKSIVNLPHTFNADDVSYGSKNMFEGKVAYSKVIPQYSGKTYIEFKGANSVCDVMINGNKVGTHMGGYSAFRFDITSFLTSPKNFLEVTVNNKNNKLVYPSKADFTFYGGLYRDVNLIHDVPQTHFSLDDCGSKGVYVTAKVDGEVHVKALISGYKTGVKVLYEVLDASGKVVANAGHQGKLFVENPILWNGMKNPYLYTLKASLFEMDKLIDTVSVRFGFREIKFDSDKGCFLNGEYIKLKGVSRHQDRQGLGNALSINEHEEDLQLIKEVGANSIRLAHYQQADEFYDLCDEMGFLVWAEIPMISVFSKKKHENAMNQLEELIKQNMHHASIFCWGVENEITIAGESDELIDCVKQLNELAHFIDPSRATTCAQLSFGDMDMKLNKITDIMGYNHYFGWYMKTCEGLDEWCEKFRLANTGIKLSLSEYGAEGVIGYFNDEPAQGDYTEAYQAKYHEHYLKVINNSDWLWGSYVWNMFDFGSVKRNEGGVQGKNNKGLVSWDRKIKKDSFYAYKAHWSDEKFAQLAGVNYSMRRVGSRSFKVYSTLDEITLEVNGEAQTLKGDKVFIFDGCIINQGENVVKVICELGEQTYNFKGIAEYPLSYSMGKDANTMIHNWFTTNDSEKKDGYFNMDSTLRELLADEKVRATAADVVGPIVNTPLAKIAPNIKIGSILNSKLLKLPEGAKDLATQFICSMEKSDK
ncbi:MAG: glycoside hydrolase family 2 TIM barrel-domain containing protein [Clostridia bacterium]